MLLFVVAVVVVVVAVVVVAEVVVVAAQGVTAIVFIIIVTENCAKAEPAMVAWAPRAMPPAERIVPMNEVLAPRVAAVGVVLATCQKTSQACAPFSRTTLLLVAVVSVLVAWKM
jgi:hypothetical protein